MVRVTPRDTLRWCPFTASYHRPLRGLDGSVLLAGQHQSPVGRESRWKGWHRGRGR